MQRSATATDEMRSASGSSRARARACPQPGPHVFGVAAATYRGLLDARSQSVIISGESGAGKTETAKRFLQFLAYAATQVGGIKKPHRTAVDRNQQSFTRDEQQVAGGGVHIWSG